MSVINKNGQLKLQFHIKNKADNLSGLEPKLIKLEFIIYLPKLKVNSCLEMRANKPINFNLPQVRVHKIIIATETYGDWTYVLISNSILFKLNFILTSK